MEIVLALLGVILALLALFKVTKERDKNAQVMLEIKSLKETLNGLNRSIVNLRVDRTKPEDVEPAPMVELRAETPLPKAPPVAPPPAAVKPVFTPPLSAASEKTVQPKPGFATEEPMPGDRLALPQWEKLEQTLGKQWMTWAGALVLFLSAGFFVKYAFDNKWLGPTGRVVLGILFGLALLIAGDRLVRRRMRALGQGLLGGGLAILYVSLFAAFGYYKILDQTPSFIFMVLVTVLGLTLAILHDSIVIAFLAVLGGLLTPVLVSTGQNARDALFSYLLLLDIGVLGVAFFRRWRALELLAFLGTLALYTGWFVEFYEVNALIPTLLWLGGFFLIFLLLPFVHHLRTLSPLTIDRFTMALGNAITAFSYAYYLLYKNYTYTLGFVALAMSACYLTLGVLVKKRVPNDARGLFGLIGLAVVFLTMAIPLHLSMHGLTLAWALEGPVLLYLGYRYRYPPVRIFATLVAVISVIRLFSEHWPLHHENFTLLFNANFASAMFVALALGALAYLHHRWSATALNIDRTVKIIAALAGSYLALAILETEMKQWFGFQSQDYYSHCLIAALWAVGALGLGQGGMRFKFEHASLIGLPALIYALVEAAYLYHAKTPAGFTMFINLRFLTGLFVTAALLGYAWPLRRTREGAATYERDLSNWLLGGVWLMLLVLLSLEVYYYNIGNVADPQRAEWLAQMSLSIVWGLFAIAMLAVGFRWKNRILRFAALGLFGIVALKLILVDMANLRQIYRIVSFVVLGLLMIGASYLYHLVEKRLISASQGEIK